MKLAAFFLLISTSALAQSYRPNSVISGNAAARERIERATMNLSGAAVCSVTRESGDWLAAATAASTVCNVNINAGVFSVAPSCSCTAHATASDLKCRFVGAPSTTLVQVALTNNAGANTTDGFDIICMGPR
jgi:hypothetical protein